VALQGVGCSHALTLPPQLLARKSKVRYSDTLEKHRLHLDYVVIVYEFSLSEKILSAHATVIVIGPAASATIKFAS
jgi:hypothetical protein